MSEFNAESSQDTLQHYEYDQAYQDQAAVLDTSLFNHRKVPLYKPNSENKSGETIVLVPDQRLGSPFDKVVVNFQPHSKDPFLPFVTVQASRYLTGREHVIETRLHYFEDMYLAVRSVYAVSQNGNYELKPDSFMESEVTTHDLSLLNEIINNSSAVS